MALNKNISHSQGLWKLVTHRHRQLIPHGQEKILTARTLAAAIILILAGLTGCTGMICNGPAGMPSSSAVLAEKAAAAADLPPIRRVDLRLGQPYKPFATYGQCQIELSYKVDPASGLPVIAEASRAKVEACLELAIRSGVHVLILPELALAYQEATRNRLVETLKKTARKQSILIIAGSFYDADRYGRLPVIGPEGEVYGYKMRPSRFEASPRYGFGMKEGRNLLLLDTVFGRIVPIACSDLLSDSVQYAVRNLATRGQVDVIVNVNFNPASWEFLIEGNSIARRHPVVITITNVSGSSNPAMKAACRKRDSGYCFGNTALFASLRGKESDCPNCEKAVADLVEPAFKDNGVRMLPYDTLVATVPPFQEGMLIYDVNLRLLREPAATNAPDQGYPVVRNVRRIPLSGQ
jgi:predicted amidohydrolase